MTNWTDFVKSFAKANNTTYGCALSDPACSAGYRKKYGVKKPLGKNKEKELMGMEDIDAKPSKKSVEFKAKKTAMKAKLNKSQVQKQLLETTGMMAEDINQFVPVQDLAGNFVPQEQLQQIKKKRGRPSKKQAEENITMEVKEIKKRGRPKKYDTAEEARKAKIANTIAGAKRRKEAKAQGKGLFSSFNKAVKSVSNTATSVVKKVKDTATAVVYGRQDYPPKVRKIISQYGGKNITGITIGRTPLGTPLMTALQVASGNTFSQKLENTPYDKLFHLFICIDFPDGKITLEKNEVINADIGCKLPKETETKNITSSDIPPALTLNDALERTRERMGGNYFTYSAKDNNCQDFIVAFLTANNIGNETDKSWVKQETKVLFDGGNNRLRKIANTLTDLGARVDVLRQGAGIKKKRKGGMIDEENDPLFQNPIPIVANPPPPPPPPEPVNINIPANIPVNKDKRKGGKIKSNSNTKMANSWIEYVKAYAKKNNMKYNEALKDPKMKAGYKKGGKFNLLKSITDVGTKVGEPFKATTGLNPFTFGYDLGHDVIAPALMKGRGMPTSRDEYISQLYDQANLGANGRVRLN
jgi:hypothetical protein